MSASSVSSAVVDERERSTVVPFHRSNGQPHAGVSTHVDESAAQHRLRVFIKMVVVATIALVDVIIIKTTWNQVLGDYEVVSWILAVLTAVGGAALMWISGALTAWTRVYPNVIHTASAGCAGLAWAALGAGLFWLRWNAAELAGTAIAVEGQVADESVAAGHQLMSVVMISLYLLPGVLAWIDGYQLSNPIEAHQRRTFAQLATLTERSQRLEAEAVKVAALHVLHSDEIDLVPEHARLAKEANAALANELRAFARSEILRRIGDPAAGGITEPAWLPPPPR